MSFIIAFAFRTPACISVAFLKVFDVVTKLSFVVQTSNQFFSFSCNCSHMSISDADISPVEDQNAVGLYKLSQEQLRVNKIKDTKSKNKAELNKGLSDEDIKEKKKVQNANKSQRYRDKLKASKAAAEAAAIPAVVESEIVSAAVLVEAAAVSVEAAAVLAAVESEARELLQREEGGMEEGVRDGRDEPSLNLDSEISFIGGSESTNEMSMSNDSEISFGIDEPHDINNVMDIDLLASDISTQNQSVHNLNNSIGSLIQSTASVETGSVLIRDGSNGSQTLATKTNIANGMKNHHVRMKDKRLAKHALTMDITNAVDTHYNPEVAHVNQTIFLNDKVLDMQRNLPLSEDPNYDSKVEYLDFTRAELSRTSRDLELIKKGKFDEIETSIHNKFLDSRRSATAAATKKRKAAVEKKKEIVTIEDAMKLFDETEGVSPELLVKGQGKKYEKIVIFAAQMLQTSLCNFKSKRYKERTKQTTIEEAIALLTIIMPNSKNRIERYMNEKFKYDYYDITFLCDTTTLNLTNVMSLR